MTRIHLMRGFGFVVLPLILLMVLVLMSSQGRAEGAYARADERVGQLYIGADSLVSSISYSGADRDAFEDNLLGVAGYAGMRLHRHAGVELSYSNTLEGEKRSTSGAGVRSDATSQLEVIGLDLMGYSPLDSAGRLELVGALGAVHSTLRQDLRRSAGGAGVSSSSRDNSELSYRLGAGLHYALKDDVSLRSMARWQQADFDGAADHALNVSVGFSYNF